MKKMVEYKLKLYDCKKYLKIPDGLSKEGTKRAIDFYKKEISGKIPKNIAKGKKCLWFMFFGHCSRNRFLFATK